LGTFAARRIGGQEAGESANSGSVLFVLGLEGLLGSLFDSLANLFIIGGRRAIHIFFRRFRRWLPCPILSLPLALRLTFGHSVLLSGGVN
jgi:hypothetical protein